MGTIFIVIGICFILVGTIFRILPGMKLPLLPGDILIERDHTTFYFPIVTSIIISIVLTVIIRFFNK